MSHWLFVLTLPAAWLLDLALGDPAWLYHPVRLVGLCIAGLERVLRRLLPATPQGERLGGALLAAALPLGFLGATALLVCLLARLHPLLGLAFDTLLCYQLLAMRSLRDESMAVCRRLAANDLAGARTAVGRIVGRDTAALDEAGVARATVETVAENTSDGVVAPLLYMALGGAPLAMWYKAVNTLDSMVGYKNDRYLHFGRASAKLDDIANFLPARASALLMLCACALPDFDAANARRVYRRDRRNHASPNSAQTEAVCAGALGLRLAGDAVYFGKVLRKPAIGDATREIEPADIARANRLMYAASLLALLFGTALRVGVVLLISH